MIAPRPLPAGSPGLRSVVALAMAVLLIQAGDPPRSEAAGPGKLARTRTTFASGLNFPYGMQPLPDGSLLVATSNPTGGGFFASTGALVRLVDHDRDGHADGPPSVLFDGLPGTLTGLARAGSLVFATSSQAGAESITVLRAGPRPADPLIRLGSIDFAFPPGWEHTTYGLAVRGSAGRYELYFNVGSQFNAEPSTGTVGLSGLIAGVARGDSIYRVGVTDRGGVPSVAGLTRIAAGLRNASGLAFRPRTGDLYFVDNGIDGLVNPDEPLSADELNRIRAGDLGGAVEHFGFPSTYVRYRTGVRVGAVGLRPLAVFQPTPDPYSGSESEGAAQLAFAPDGESVFIGFHGRYALGGIANEENPLLQYSLERGRSSPLVGNDEPGVGHLDGLLSTSDFLFAADLSSTGDLAPGTGVIYRFRFR